MVEKKRKTISANTIFWMVIVLFPIFGHGQEMYPLPKPIQFEAGVPRSKLIIVKEMPLEFDDDGYMAQPIQIISNSQGKIFIYDSKLVKVFMFDKNYEYIGEFLEKGNGPGEAMGTYGTTKRIHVGRNEKLYLIDSYADKIVEFTNTGEYQRDIKVNRIPKHFNMFVCVADKDGYFYATSVNNGIIDFMDSKWKMVHTLLSRNLMDNFIYYKPEFEKYYGTFLKGKRKTEIEKKMWLDPSIKNVVCDLTSNNELFIYLYNSSTVYLYNGKNLVRKFNVLIDNVLTKYKDERNSSIRNRKKMPGSGIINTYIPLFSYCFLDYDEPYFYLQYMGEKKIHVSPVRFFGKTCSGHIISTLYLYKTTLKKKWPVLHYCRKQRGNVPGYF